MVNDERLSVVVNDVSVDIDRVLRSEKYKTVAYSKYFDGDFYLENNQDVALSGIDPCLHYLIWGWQEGRSPSKAFSGQDYYITNPDVLTAAMNPLVHYELYGKREGRCITPVTTRQVAYVEVIDKCQLACPTCVRGVQIQKNTNKSMPLPMFAEIVEKLRREGYGKVGIYSWTEPFLLRSMDQYVAVVKRAGLNCELSTNLSHAPSAKLYIMKALAAGVDFLIVSISGFTQKVYEIYHKNGRIDWIKDNLKAISYEIGRGTVSTSVRIRFLKWPHNEHEITLCEKMAQDLGLEFEVIDGIGDPFQPFRNDHFADTAALSKTGRSSISDRYEAARSGGNVCHLITQTIAIDSSGSIYECCAYPYLESLKIGSYLDMTDDQILLSRFTHPVCATCKIERRACSKSEDERLERVNPARTAA